ncbi:class I SAM-dependent methyltransferase [Citromicrobium bathyomarinum]|uniref:class I SAM-dependent methyltransferase n=1 Tax=Citromicrobium bathyomarinum TaxID=72174 RepID=UPI00315A81C7
MSDKAAAWKAFWAQQGPGNATGCLPARWQSVFAELEGAWRKFAAGLPENARVLDLATGDARVLHWLGEARADVTRTGVDLAPSLPPAPPGVSIHTGVAMEDLPFEDDGFDAVVSQFGVEYGEPPATAREVARTTTEDATVALIVHRGDGAILAHNLARAEQIRWVLDETGLIDATKAAVTEDTAPWATATASVAAVVDQGRQRYGDRSAGWEIPEAIRRSLVMGAQAGDSAAGVIGLLDRIESQARNELARIDSLAGACETADAREDFLAAFEAHDLALTDSRELHDAAGRLFAEMLELRRT